MSQPLFPVCTNSSAAPIWSVAITGNPAAKPSGTTSPQPSYRDGTHNTSALVYSRGNSSQSRNPANSTRSLTDRTTRAIVSLNSPSPTILSRTFENSRANLTNALANKSTPLRLIKEPQKKNVRSALSSRSPTSNRSRSEKYGKLKYARSVPNSFRYPSTANSPIPQIGTADACNFASFHLRSILPAHAGW